MFGWFGPNERTKALATDITLAQLERAALALRLLNVEPTVTEFEISSMWFAATEMMRVSNESLGAVTELQSRYQAYARDFFDHYCQNVLSTVCKSQINLARDREQIQANYLNQPVPTDWGLTGRFPELSEVFLGLTTNSMRLSRAMLTIVLAQLTPTEKRKARAYTAFLIERTKNLSEFEVESSAKFMLTVFT